MLSVPISGYALGVILLAINVVISFQKTRHFVIVPVLVTAAMAMIVDTLSPATFTVDTEAVFYASMFTLVLHVTIFRLLGGSFLKTYFRIITQPRKTQFGKAAIEGPLQRITPWSPIVSFLGVLLATSMNIHSFTFTIVVMPVLAMYGLYRLTQRQVPPVTQPRRPTPWSNMPTPVPA